ncbi:MAG: ABC transporter substrate-binding protein [Propionibacteriaceae bacterium]|nr:ABC transporter substrate-binding protein [Propionibacteriaceae bacterium]
MTSKEGTVKKFIALTLAALLAIGTAACTGSTSGSKSTPGQASSGSGYFLNSDPELKMIFNQIVAEYRAETGVDIAVTTAAEGTYEQTLTAELSKERPPTIFQVSGPTGFAKWKDSMTDITGSDLHSHMIDPTLAITYNNRAYGIPLTVAGYGIIYNDTIMKAYFALSDKAVSFSAATEINSFAKLKQVVEDMTKHSAQLGIDGVFSGTTLRPEQLVNVPFHYEFKASNVDLKQGAPKEVSFEYNLGFQGFFDLLQQNSTLESGTSDSLTSSESLAEFATGKSAMVVGGNWDWEQIAYAVDSKVKADDVHIMPLYMGIDGEETQGLCIGSERYFAINALASEEDKRASLDFLYWLVSSPTGKDYLTTRLISISPFDTFSAEEGLKDPLSIQVSEKITTGGINNVPWVYPGFPVPNFKKNLGAALSSYAQGDSGWDTVTQTVVSAWQAQP